MLTLLDNYDSFTYNLVHYYGELGVETNVYRNDTITTEEVINLKPEGIVLSPGPCDPNSAGISLELIKEINGKIPLLGVCLGHQSIAQAFGAKIIRAAKPIHGKPSKINHNGNGLFTGLPDRFEAIRYHSLTVSPDSIKNELTITATTDDNTVMAITHKKWPIYGVQFHPESIETEYGRQILSNFLNLSKQWRNAA